MKKLDVVVVLLLIFGAINWGLKGIFGLNLVEYIFGGIWIDKVIYFLIGASAIYVLWSWKKLRLKKAK